MRFGLPFWFVSSGMSATAPTPEEAGTADTYPHAEMFNPWENPTSGNGPRFLASAAAFGAPAFAAIFLFRRIRRRRVVEADLDDQTMNAAS